MDKINCYHCERLKRSIFLMDLFQIHFFLPKIKFYTTLQHFKFQNVLHLCLAILKVLVTFPSINQFFQHFWL